MTLCDVIDPIFFSCTAAASFLNAERLCLELISRIEENEMALR